MSWVYEWYKKKLSATVCFILRTQWHHHVVTSLHARACSFLLFGLWGCFEVNVEKIMKCLKLMTLVWLLLLPRLFNQLIQFHKGGEEHYSWTNQWPGRIYGYSGFLNDFWFNVMKYFDFIFWIIQQQILESGYFIYNYHDIKVLHWERILSRSPHPSSRVNKLHFWRQYAGFYSRLLQEISLLFEGFLVRPTNIFY